jgi:HemY protein
MRIALWFIGLFGVAVALALFASGNGSTVTVFWPPHRVDLSLNMVLLTLLLLFLLVHLALKALAAMFAMPGQARSWRIRHQERVMYSALLDALSHLVAGRFIRAKKAAELVLAREQAMSRSGEPWPNAARLRALSHLLVAESAQSLQDKVSRDVHFQLALAQAALPDASGTRDGVQLRAVRWALEDRDAKRALDWLAQMPLGVSRRTVALRLRLKVARLAGQAELALDTARLLVKHKAFVGASAQSLISALVLELVQNASDPEQLQSVWAKLESAEKCVPDVAVVAAGRLMRLGGNVGRALDWLLPVWEHMAASPQNLGQEQKIVLVRVMENGFSTVGAVIDGVWLSRIERAQIDNPGDACLQYLAGVACLHLQLWGKAQQLISHALPRLEDAGLLTRAWQVLAELAQRQGDEQQATLAWKQAAQVTLHRKA